MFPFSFFKLRKDLERQLQLQNARSLTKAGYRKWAWILKVFEEWKKKRNEAVLREDYSGEPVIQEDIDEMSDELLDFALARFVAEVRKKDGQEYPGKTLYEILSSIQMYLRVQCKRNITLSDKKGCTFRKLI